MLPAEAEAAASEPTVEWLNNKGAQPYSPYENRYRVGREIPKLIIPTPHPLQKSYNLQVLDKINIKQERRGGNFFRNNERECDCGCSGLTDSH